jgi:hypothetical protein
MYKSVSKSVKEGMAVTIRGDKVIVCSKLSHMQGIWTNGFIRHTITPHGIRISTCPAGIVCYGPCQVKIIKEK